MGVTNRSPRVTEIALNHAGTAALAFLTGGLPVLEAPSSGPIDTAAVCSSRVPHVPGAPWCPSLLRWGCCQPRVTDDHTRAQMRGALRLPPRARFAAPRGALSPEVGRYSSQDPHYCAWCTTAHLILLNRHKERQAANVRRRPGREGNCQALAMLGPCSDDRHTACLLARAHRARTAYLVHRYI